MKIAKTLSSSLLKHRFSLVLTFVALLGAAALSKAGTITSVAETGGDGAPAAQFTGNTFTGPNIGTYTVPLFGATAKSFADRVHAWTNASGTTALPPYLVGQEYIMIRNDNRDNNGGLNGGSAGLYRLNVTVGAPVNVYLLIDNRLNDANAANPPTFGPTNMNWVLTEGWAPKTNGGFNRTANLNIPDEVGVDENADGSINNWDSVYVKTFPAGTFTLKEPNIASRNMYGVVVAPSGPASPPGVTAGLAAVNGDTQVGLTWTVTAGATGYSIRRSPTSGSGYVEVGTSAGASFTDTGLMNGVDYFYVVVATNDLGAGPSSNEAAGHPNPVVTGIVAAGGTNQIVLSWSALGGAVSYTVSRTVINGGPATNIASGLVGTAYTDSGLPAGRSFFYRVSADLGVPGTSGQSAVVTNATAPNTPDVGADSFGSTGNIVRWTNSDPVLAQFVVEQSLDGMAFSVAGSVAGTVRSFVHSNLLANTTYFYRVQATNAGGYSSYSAVVSNKTPLVPGFHVNFGTGANNSAGDPVAPLLPGYLADIGDLFGDRGNGFSYGWTNAGMTNITRDARYRRNASSPDLRYDTFNHFQKSLPSATWNFQVTNGFYRVRIVGGDPTAIDSTLTYDVEGTATTPYVPVAGAWWADVTALVLVTDGMLTVTTGPGGANNKIDFIDILPESPVAPVFGTQPQNLTVEDGHPATLFATISTGTMPLTYQWYLEGMPVGGNSATLSIAHARQEHVGNYVLVVTNYGGSVTSQTARLTLIEDTNPPTLVSIGCLDGTHIGVCFSEQVDDSMMVVSDQYAYKINDTEGLVKSVTIRPDGRSVVLETFTPVPDGNLRVEAIGHTDFATIPNTIGGTGAVATMTFVTHFAGDVGGPARAGSHFTCDNNAIEIVGGGADVWGTADQFYLISRAASGDFDARVRVTSVVGSNNITKAVLVARESTNSDSAGFHISVNPTPPGRDQIQPGLRTNTASQTGLWGANFTPGGVPNAWLRISRLGNVFTGYRSTNGVDWIALGTNVSSYASSLQIGIGLTAHDNTLLATGTFSNFRISTPVGPTLSDEVYSGGTFTAKFQTLNGFTYSVLYKNTVTDPAWATLATGIVGDGAMKTFTDPGPVSPTLHRIYRVRFD